MLRIDLHTHSLCSDGSDTPTELIEKAARAGLDVVALTDHDTVSGWEESAMAAGRVGVSLVRGAEFSTEFDGHGQHLLGYEFDPDHSAVAEILRQSSTAREDRFDGLVARLEELGAPIDRAYAVDLAGGIPSRSHVAHAMVAAGHVRDLDQAFSAYLNEGAAAYVPRYRPTTPDAITAIRDAGGVAVLAHPRDAKRGTAAVTDEQIADLQRAGLAGLEVDHESHSSEVREELRALAAELGLHATGSSDYHGTRKTGHGLGCNLTRPSVAKTMLQLAL